MRKEAVNKIFHHRSGHRQNKNSILQRITKSCSPRVVPGQNKPWFFHQKVGEEMNLINFATVFGNEFDLPVHRSEKRQNSAPKNNLTSLS
ncbi:hypothetical protein [Chryseolinea soli]|uniref:hypothetical protein n=1 Tax=Chryseolinea soli TaxID=2321403 RepID=UPI00135BDF46|nr:hypothetical protein [Chryseolinea soli]